MTTELEGKLDTTLPEKETGPAEAASSPKRTWIDVFSSWVSDKPSESKARKVRLASWGILLTAICGVGVAIFTSSLAKGTFLLPAPALDALMAGNLEASNAQIFWNLWWAFSLAALAPLVAFEADEWLVRKLPPVAVRNLRLPIFMIMGAFATLPIMTILDLKGMAATVQAAHHANIIAIEAIDSAIKAGGDIDTRALKVYITTQIAREVHHLPIPADRPDSYEEWRDARASHQPEK